MKYILSMGNLCLVLSILSGTLIFSGCGKKSDTSTPAVVDSCAAGTIDPTIDTVNSLTRLQVTPSVAASCVSVSNDPHQIYPPSTTAKNILTVFFPGTGAIPSDYSFFLQRGANRGYHVIGLSYPNTDAIGTLCSNNAPTSLTCFAELRQEVITGADTSTLINVDTNNSIQGRLLALLKYLSCSVSIFEFKTY